MLECLGRGTGGAVEDRAKRLADALAAVADDGAERVVLATLGAGGAVLATSATPGAVAFAAPEPRAVANANGAGDALLGVAAAATVRGAALEDAVRAGLAAAATVVARDDATPEVDAAWLDARLGGGP